MWLLIRSSFQTYNPRTKALLWNTGDVNTCSKNIIKYLSENILRHLKEPCFHTGFKYQKLFWFQVPFQTCGFYLYGPESHWHVTSLPLNIWINIYETLEKEIELKNIKTIVFHILSHWERKMTIHKSI